MADNVLLDLVRRLKIVCIFAADIVPTDEPLYAGFGWRSGRAMESDKTGPVFSYERVIAAAALHRMNPSIILVPSGGVTNTANKECPPIASVITFELIQLGVPRSAIVEEPGASSTQTQVSNCAELLRQMEWAPQNIGILAPSWQFGRIAAIISLSKNSEPFAVGVTHLLGMERILASTDKSWDSTFCAWYATSEAREMFAKEALGTGQLWTGHQPKWPNPFRGFPDPLAP